MYLKKEALDHYRNPRNCGEIDDAHRVGKGETIEEARKVTKEKIVEVPGGLPE